MVFKEWCELEIFISNIFNIEALIKLIFYYIIIMLKENKLFNYLLISYIIS